MRVVLGGTFDPLHKGHKALFKRTFELASGDTVIIGLTSDQMAQHNRVRSITPFHQRKQLLEDYLNTMLDTYPGTKIEIIQIGEVFNTAITQDIEADALVVSEGRTAVAEETNKYRKKFGKMALEIIAVPYVLAQDGLPIKATRITNEEIDTDGRLLGVVKVAVGTENDIKVAAVKNVFNKMFQNLELVKVPVGSGVSAQPWGDETISGAVTRANKAMEQTPDAHFGVGIEAGLFHNNKIEKYFDVQYCAIRDRGKRITFGHGSGFYYPEKVLESVKAGNTVGQVMSELTGVDEIGKKQGAISYLSNELLNRQGLTEQAVLMALVPRVTDLYD